MTARARLAAGPRPPRRRRATSRGSRSSTTPPRTKAAHLVRLQTTSELANAISPSSSRRLPRGRLQRDPRHRQRHLPARDAGGAGRRRAGRRLLVERRHRLRRAAEGRRPAAYLPHNIETMLPRPFARPSNADGYWFASNISPYGIVYNTELVSEAEAPKTWQDLLDPKWKDQVAIAHPGFSGSMGMFAIACANSTAGSTSRSWRRTARRSAARSPTATTSSSRASAWSRSRRCRWPARAGSTASRSRRCSPRTG